MKRAFALLGVFALTVAAKPVDWTRTVTRTAAGGHILGNPKAPVRVVEFVSYSCPHCAHYIAESAVALKDRYLRGGRVSVEFRSAVRDRYDFAAALLARCGGPARMVGDTRALFAAQEALMQQAAAYQQANPAPPPGDVTAAVTGIAEGGLIAFMAKRGLPPTRARACLADPRAQAQILAMTRDAFETRGLTSTPSILVNDVLAGNSWAEVEPRIRAALGR